MSFSTQVKQELYPLQKNYFTLLKKTISIDSYDAALDEESEITEEDRRASIRGAFLVGGSVSDPAKSYHLEITVHDAQEAKELADLLQQYEIEAGVHRRKTSYVVYVKEGSHIADLLGVMGAHKAVLDFENARILREMRGSVNRQVNCETANIRRTVDTSVRQVAAITKIEETMGISSLPSNLQEMARIRLAYPDASLAQLGEFLHPPVGKSGVNHRLRRILQIADTL